MVTVIGNCEIHGEFIDTYPFNNRCPYCNPSKPVTYIHKEKQFIKFMKIEK